jgi:enhancing lycopene biosynthesis protein 2
MTLPVAVILSGCGKNDGSEIHEATIALLKLADAGFDYQCFAPDDAQRDVVNHLSGETMNEQRNILIEAARIARGNIKPVDALHPDNFSAVVLPGGFGAAKNLSDFALKGAECSVRQDVLDAVRGFIDAGKPVGLICIAPALAPRFFGKGVKCTIGNDPDTAAAIEAMGGQHVNCKATEAVLDPANLLVSTPAYMLAENISEVGLGIGCLVAELKKLVNG